MTPLLTLSRLIFSERSLSSFSTASFIFVSSSPGVSFEVPQADKINNELKITKKYFPTLPPPSIKYRLNYDRVTKKYQELNLCRSEERRVGKESRYVR